MLKYVLCWFPMILIAVMNGAARDLWYKKLTGELAAHQLSTISLIILLGIYIWYVAGRFPFTNSREAIITGFTWLVLTLGFEFGLGFYRGASWSKMLADYDILKGRIWVLVPIWTVIAPYLFYSIRYKK